LAACKREDGQAKRARRIVSNEYTPAPIVCDNKVLYLQAYHIKDPESLLTQIVSTKAITRPSIAAAYHVYKPAKRTGLSESSAYTNTKPLVSKTLKTIDVDDQHEIYTGQLLLTTDNEPALYKAFVIRSYRGAEDSIPISQKWEKIKSHEFPRNSLSRPQPAEIKSTTYTIPIPKEYLSRSGNYRVIVVPGFLQPGSSTTFAHFFPEKTASLTYTVQRRMTWQDWLTIALSTLGILSVPIITIMLQRKRRQKIRLLQQEQLVKESRLKLDLVRAQLNPHFVHNALSGIQNLLHKNHIPAADKYLAKFSRLSRKILNDSERELISLDDEVQLLDDYLQMEQMRFGFSYSFQTDDEIDAVNTEIPAMLIQPFVENAVKHGVSSVSNGYITIQFEKSGQNILIGIRDNGQGYTPSALTGKGSTLSQNRIGLLNDIYKATPIHLSVTSDHQGTYVRITLNKWLE